jgi:peptidoglycan-associated lipoprotein
MKTTLVALNAALLVALGSLGLGCKDEPKAQTADDVDTAKPANTAKKPAEGDKSPDTQSGVKIDDKIVKACGDLPTARFGFDSADVSAEASNVLDALARCFISGPLKGKGVTLVGHADPRGGEDYNFGLGQRRSGSIAKFLAKKGMEEGKITATSRGDLEATGTDEAGWAADRKVEIRLSE